jgi:ATP-dependent DNA helicase RecQ
LTKSSEALQYLKRYWGYDGFRSLQGDIIESISSGNDTLALLPTGGGKSLCYQVPALMSEGICIVVSPLVSLMQDQVNDLNSRGIKAVNVSGMLSGRDLDRILDNAVFGNFKLLYVSPERIQTDLFRERFKRMNVSFIAVDEAHCISQWGYDFRPSYLEISSLRDLSPEIPIIALTATATSSVMNDISRNLEMKDVKIFKKSFSRENIAFINEKKNDRLNEILRHLKEQDDSSIVYVRSRKMCAEIDSFLNANGIKSSYYHAGLNHNLRQERQDKWMKGEVDNIVATNAFGMGIDKDNVRKVIHWDVPDSLEAYYQEAGRAGRDGKTSQAILLWNESDIHKLRTDHEKSFPSGAEIAEIYQKVLNHFQLGKGDVTASTFNFSIQDLASKINAKPSLLLNVLNELEKRLVLVLNDTYYIPSLLRLKISKNEIHKLMSGSPTAEKILTFLMRHYPGILENDIEIDEKYISENSGVEVNKLEKFLEYLSSTDSIEYRSSKGENLITFIPNRPEVKELLNESHDYSERKNWHLKRVESVIDYIQSNTCRQEFILSYFDEKSTSTCGRCDVCMSEDYIVPKEKKLISFINNNALNGQITISDIESAFKDSKREEIISMCRKLNDQGMVKFVPPETLVLMHQ